VLNAFVDGSMAGLSRSETAVWLVLYRDCRDGTARTGMADIARRAGCDKRTVVRAVHRLERYGLVQVVRRGGLGRGPSVYRVRGVPRAAGG
jgi:DNA-binding MarR family transcriptional regulator